MKQCYKCPDRTVEPNCHDTCPRYLAEKAAHTEAVRKAANDNVYIEVKPKKKEWHRYAHEIGG